MDKALFIAMTGAKHNMLAQANRANNLANVNTTGFRADFEQSRAMGVYYGDGLPTRAYALTESPRADFSQGPLITTGDDLDIALQGEGFIAIQAPDGTEAYTRNGDLAIDGNGNLRTENGLPVMGVDGPINIPENQRIHIGTDGTISMIGLGEGPENIVEVARIKLVNPDFQNLEKGDDGLFRQRDGLIAAQDNDVRVMQGMLEGSNVNAVSEFTQVMSLSRQYEMQIKLMKSADENTQASTQLMQMA